MRKALVTLFSVGLLGAVLIPSCVVKDDGDGGNSGKGGSGAGNSGGSSAVGGKGNQSGGGDGNSAGSGGASTPTTSVADACPDLKFTSETGEACTAMNMSATYKDIHMLVVLDKSGSMDNTPEGFGKSKWAATKEALAAALESSTDKVRYGLLMYPYSLGSAIPAKDCGTRCCELPQPVDAINVPVGAASDTVPAIVDLLNSTEPGGGTPTAKALAAAFNYYTVGDGARLPPGEKYVLLATDGGPNCATGLTCEGATCTADMDHQSTCGTTIQNCCQQTYANAGGGPTLCLDDQGVLEQINALSDAGIKTFVVGIPGTENYKTYLKAFAEAGGAPDPNNPDVGYYAVNEADGVAGLTQTFKGITESLVRSCDVKLAQAPQYTDQLNVAVECQALAQTDGTIVNWEYNNDLANPMITIKGTTCDTIENQGVTRVDVIEGCKKFVIQ